jgi:Fe-S cluster biogenesis protein NfuA/nitrite reductase/ring-hydroxylating ferredoxin subunit
MVEPVLALDDRAARERVARVEVLLEELESSIGAVSRDTALELVSALIDLYGEGLARMVEHVAARDDDGALARAMAADELVSHLLLLHGLHPVPVEARVRAALHEVRPYLESHGGDVELLGIDDGVVRVRMQGSCDGCASSAVTLKLAIEDAVHKAAPDVDRVEAEGATVPAHPPPPALLQIELSDALRAPAPPGAADADAAAASASWAIAGAMPELESGGPVLRRVAGEPVLFVGVGAARYAYRPGCAACGASMDGGALAGDELRCPACGHAYDVRRAGRSLQSRELHLEPVPLLVDPAGLLRVALGAAA